MSKKQRAYALPTNKSADRKEKARLVKGKYLAIVTGAGHGLGRAIASLAFQDQGILPDAWAGSKLCLIDVDEEALNETAGKKMRQFLAHRKIDVDLFPIDLGNISEISYLMNEIGSKYEKDFERVILVNCASSLGEVNKLLTAADCPPIIQNFWDLNITSKICMTNQVCKIFVRQEKTVVDVTFKYISVPTSTLGLACMASSAISTFDEIFAKENPNVRVLHYVTENLDTRAVTKVIADSSNTTLTDELNELKEENKLTPVLDAAKRMIKSFEKVDFVKGAVLHIDPQAALPAE